MRTLLGSVVGGLSILLAVLVAPTSAHADVGICAASGPAICLDLSHAPAADVPVSRPDQPSFIAYRAVVRNVSTSTAAHVRLVDTPPAETPVSVTTTAGVCTTATGRVSCEFGNLKAGGQVQVEIVVRAPEQPGTIHNAAQVTYDEGTNDASDAAKQDTLPADGPLQDPTTVSVPSGSTATWVPAEQPVALATDAAPAGPQNSVTMVADLPAQAKGYEAALARTPGPAFTCPRRQVCRSGDWILATVDGGRTFDVPLEFRLRWDASVVPRKQNVRNLVVFYQQTLSSPVEVVSERCGPDLRLPCLKDVTEQPDGDFTAVLVQDHNGYMR